MRSGICFATSDYDQLWAEYLLLTSEFTGWSLTEIRSLAHREREFAVRTAMARIDRRHSG